MCVGGRWQTLYVGLLRVLLGVLVALAATWAVLILVLVVFRPHGISLLEAKRRVPDILRLVRALGQDSPAEQRAAQIWGCCSST